MKEAKEVITLVTSLISAMEKSYEDGKFTWTDLINFKDVIANVGPGIIGSSKVIEELRNLTNEQKKELIEFAKDEFDIGNDKIEEAIESVCFAVFHIAYVFRMIRDNKGSK